MSKFAIMKAHHLTEGHKCSLSKIARSEYHKDCTILVATRHYGWNKTSKVFIIGAQGDYGVKAGDQVQHIIDTGNGYRGGYERLDIEGVLQVRNGMFEGPQELVRLPARSTFVMK